MRNRFIALLLLLPPASHAAKCDFKPLCLYDKPLCEDFGRLDVNVEALAAKRLGAPEGKATGQEITPLNAQFRNLNERVKTVLFRNNLKEDDPDFLVRRCLRAKINVLSLDVIPMTLGELAAVLDGLEKRVQELEKAMVESSDLKSRRNDFAKEIGLINDEGSRLWSHVHDAALNIDDMGPYYHYPIPRADGTIATEGVTPPNLRLLSRVNPLQERVAALSQKLQRLDAMLGRGGRSAEEMAAEAKNREETVSGFKDPFETLTADEAAVGGEGLVVAGGFESHRNDASLAATSPAATLLGMKHATIRHVPPPPVSQNKPPVQSFLDKIAGAFSIFTDGAFSYDSDPGEVRQIIKLRDSGLTQTAGDPGGRAKYNFLQTGGTCVIAAQVQVLSETHGIVDDETKKKMEDVLYAKAVKAGYLASSEADPNRRETGGTPRQYVGSLLDMPITKHFRAEDGDLNRAVLSGRMIIASANTGLLWNDQDFANQNHVFVITGAEIDPATKKVLGYYINDTGTGQAGRLVAAEQFLKAWRASGARFVEPQ